MDPAYAVWEANYINMVWSQNESGETERSTVKTPISLVPCNAQIQKWRNDWNEDAGMTAASDQRFGNWFQNLNCYKNDGYRLEGSFLSDQWSFIEITLKPCLGDGCKNETEIASYIDE
jgi:hypothetical protein